MDVSVLDELSAMLERAGRRQGWWGVESMAVGCSGGSDSMALLWLMVHRWPGMVLAVHLDHGLRGDEGHADAAFVAEWCRGASIPVRILRRDVPAEARKGESMELAARRIRHQALIDAAREWKASAVALAHTSDDVVETFFLNLSRGTGLYGLAGIPDVRGDLVRPVLEASRERLRELLREVRWPWVEDHTNDQDRYLRNRVRHELLPLLENRINQGVRRHVLDLVSDMRRWRHQEETEASLLAERLTLSLPRSLAALSRTGVLALARERQASLFRHMGRSLGLPVLSRNRTEGLLELAKKSSRWRFQWGGTVELCSHKNFLAWIDRSLLEESPPQSVNLERPRGRTRWGIWDVAWSYKRDVRSFRAPMEAAIPISDGDACTLFSASQVPERKKWGGPWWLADSVPVLAVDERPVWSPSFHVWKNGWDFPSNSVKCDGVCLIRFTCP
ncbi:MAG: tRNA lysidine(34) synthetase TilS [Dethiosulfovibrio peptidovorans]|nr:MAG: tRNA lysidine(34) synthetase TilS [Dethiosulfovibrio peptidovorans]